MKKTFYVYLFVAIVLCGFVSSCSDDEPRFTSAVTEETVFSELSLKLTSSDKELLGKQVKVTPNAQDKSKAMIELSGLDLKIPNIFDSNAGMLVLPGNGVVPGEITTTFEVTISSDGKVDTFEGEDVKDGRTIKYTGKMTKESLELALDVKINQKGFKYSKLELAPSAAFQFTPIHIEWDADKFPFLGIQYNIESALKMMTMFVKIDGKPLSEALTSILKEVSFMADGNIIAQYKDSINENEWKTSPINLATYSVEADNKIKMFLNVQNIMETAMQQKSKATEDKGSAKVWDPYLPKLMEKVLPYLKTGVPVCFTEDETGKIILYLDKDFLLPILELFVPMLKDDAAVIAFMEDLKTITPPNMQQKLTLGKPIFKAFPNLVKTTRTLKLGLEFNQPEAGNK